MVPDTPAPADNVDPRGCRGISSKFVVGLVESLTDGLAHTTCIFQAILGTAVDEGKMDGSKDHIGCLQRRRKYKRVASRLACQAKIEDLE